MQTELFFDPSAQTLIQSAALLIVATLRGKSVGICECAKEERVLRHVAAISRLWKRAVCKAAHERVAQALLCEIEVGLPECVSERGRHGEGTDATSRPLQMWMPRRPGMMRIATRSLSRSTFAAT